MKDWSQIKEEYIATDSSCRKLAAKYGLAHSTVSLRATKEGWPQLRKARRQEEQKLTDALQTVADKLLHRIEASVDGDEKLDVKDLRALVSAVKDLIAIREACPELERLARVAELENALGGQSGGIEVVFRAGEEEWNG